MHTEATAQDHEMMRRALALAEQAAALGEVPVGAIIHRHGDVLAEAHNQREQLNDPTAHAEIVALRQAAIVVGSWRLDDCTMVVTLEPCPMCAGALVNARVPQLVYGSADPKMGCVDTLARLCTEPRFNHRINVVRNVLADDAARLLRAFFEARRPKRNRSRPGTPA